MGFQQEVKQPSGAGSALGTNERGCGFVCCHSLSPTLLTWCHTSIGLNELPGPLARTLREDADQSRWMDKRTQKSSGKAFTWMIHCNHNTPTARNQGKS